MEDPNSVLLVCPVRGSARMAAMALATHRALHGVRRRLYFDDSGNAEVGDMLRTEAALNGDAVVVFPPPTEDRPDYDTAGPTHVWTPQLCSRVQAMRQHACDMLIVCGYRYMFMVDLDVWCHPNTVRYLTAAKRQVVSAVYWSKWSPTMPWLPNVWDIHQYGFAGPESIIRLRQPGVYPVGGLGACTLIHRGAVAMGANYKPVEGLPWPLEDRHFCVRAACAGVELWAATGLPPFHVYREDMWDEAVHWYNELGADPNYFRQRWLTDAWADNITQTTAALAGGQ